MTLTYFTYLPLAAVADNGSEEQNNLLIEQESKDIECDVYLDWKQRNQESLGIEEWEEQKLFLQKAAGTLMLLRAVTFHLVECNRSLAVAILAEPTCSTCDRPFDLRSTVMEIDPIAIDSGSWSKWSWYGCTSSS